LFAIIYDFHRLWARPPAVDFLSIKTADTLKKIIYIMDASEKMDAGSDGAQEPKGIMTAAKVNAVC
jgi:hypothetical protein